MFERDKILALRRKVFLDEELPEMFRKIRMLDISMEEITQLFNKTKEKDS